MFLTAGAAPVALCRMPRVSSLTQVACSELAKSTSSASQIPAWPFQFQPLQRRYICLRTDIWASLKAQSVAPNTDGKEAEIIKSEHSVQLGRDHLE